VPEKAGTPANVIRRKNRISISPVYSRKKFPGYHDGGLLAFKLGKIKVVREPNQSIGLSEEYGQAWIATGNMYLPFRIGNRGHGPHGSFDANM